MNLHKLTLVSFFKCHPFVVFSENKITLSNIKYMHKIRYQWHIT